MVTEKVVVVLMIVAIVLSVVSVIVTISALNLRMMPAPEQSINIVRGHSEDDSQGRVSIVIFPPEAAPNLSNG